jgi:hypothetical protein
MWYRVFGASDAEPPPAATLERLNELAPVAGAFHGDDAGWFRAELTAAGAPMELERFLATEEGIRAELNSWAAHVEACGDSPEHVRLMERMIQTRQLFTVRGTASDEVCIALCRFLAETTDGVYQIDGRGFFATDGAPLLPDE